MTAFVLADVAQQFNYYAALALTLLGLYAMITRRHLLRKVVGMGIFQTGIILFFISTGAKWNATIPIDPEKGPVDPVAFVNPLPHALMLTAIVVAVATLGVALAIVARIRDEYGTLDEEEILGRRG